MSLGKEKKRKKAAKEKIRGCLTINGLLMGSYMAAFAENITRHPQEESSSGGGRCLAATILKAVAGMYRGRAPAAGSVSRANAFALSRWKCASLLQKNTNI